MQKLDPISLGVYVTLLVLLSPLLGSYLHQILNQPTNRFEKYFYRCTKTLEHPMNWQQYAWAVITLQLIGLITLLVLFKINQREVISWHLALNTAISFITNTNWQAYVGESALDYKTQLLGLTVQNFLSAATGIAVLLVLIRGITYKETQNLGNFWVDMTRIIFYVLLPFSVLIALFLVSQGAIQNFSPSLEIIGLEGHPQLLPMGPAASQTAISVLGSNGGGFFGANLAHPFVNPTALSNFVLTLCVVLIPASLIHYYGLQVGASKQAWILFCVCLCLFLLFCAATLLSQLSWGSVTGQEVRFSGLGSVLLLSNSTATSNGSTNAIIGHLAPLTAGFMMLQIMLGEIIFGGVGCGLYGLLLFALLTVFLAGLMVGRTPEFLGKKIESQEIKWVLIGILAPSAIALVGAAFSCLNPEALKFLAKRGPHGLSEILYTWVSTSNNNGSGYGELRSNNLYWNISLGMSMLIGRFSVLLAALKIAGSLSKKKYIVPSPGTFRTDTALFGILLGISILLIGALTFMPGWFLGPLLEHSILISKGASL